MPWLLDTHALVWWWTDDPAATDWSWLNSLAGPLDEDFERAALDRPTAATLPETETETDKRSE